MSSRTGAARAGRQTGKNHGCTDDKARVLTDSRHKGMDSALESTRSTKREDLLVNWKTWQRTKGSTMESMKSLQMFSLTVAGRVWRRAEKAPWTCKDSFFQSSLRGWEDKGWDQPLWFNYTSTLAHSIFITEKITARIYCDSLPHLDSARTSFPVQPSFPSSALMHLQVHKMQRWVWDIRFRLPGSHPDKY